MDKKTIAQREKTHGGIERNSYIAQEIKKPMRFSRNWDDLNCVQRECLEMMAHKIGRFLSGEMGHLDHVQDLTGYCLLLQEATEKKHGGD